MRALALLALTGCLPGPYDECNPTPDSAQSHYDIWPEVLTPGGVSVDRSGQNVNLNRIDQAISDVEVCLRRPIRSECVVVKVAPEHSLSCNEANGGRFQLLPEAAPQDLCSEKGLAPDPACPCRWRVIQQDGAIVVPPDMRMLPAGLAALATGRANVWEGELAKCAAPMGPMAGE